MPDPHNILVLNTGSSSVKFAVFDQSLTTQLQGQAEGIGTEAGRLRCGAIDQTLPLPDHETALSAVLDCLSQSGIAQSALAGVAHRVVHGGTALQATTLITPTVRAQIAACIPLAPLHNPHALAGIDALSRHAPDLPQVACFDTAFHATNSDVATQYALPPEITARGIRRYGFHGTSYAALVRRWPDVTGQPLPPRLLALHLGNGASLCAIQDGKSVATTMGYSPLEGLTMGTRAGGIDANAVLRLAEEDGIAATRALLNGQSGLKGLSGLSADMRSLSQADSERARFAIDHFCYWALRHAGSLMAAMGGLDAIVFTGGIGENDAHVRAQILNGLSFMGVEPAPAKNESNGPDLHAPHSRVTAWIIPAEEERQIALDAANLLPNFAFAANDPVPSG